ncbi:hypothetical protein Ancab_026377 [Ancistrocladus abbreviatus]
MTGQLSQSVGLSKFLRQLDLSGNNFHGPIPPWIWNTTEVIALVFNYFTGGLPSSVNLTTLSGLTEIDIASNLLSGETPSWMFCLPSMQWLDLNSNQFKGELPLLLNQSRLSKMDTKYGKGLIRSSQFRSFSQFSDRWLGASSLEKNKYC